MEQNVQNEMAVFSKMLRELMLDEHAFVLAMKQGYIVTADNGGGLVWMLGSKTLLAYFLGRLFCGDKGCYSKRKHGWLWKAGRKMFPGAMLGRVFGVNSLRILRAQRKNLGLPHKFQIIDNLFVME